MEAEADADAAIPRVTQTTTVTFMGETRKTFAGLMIIEWAFLAVSVVNIVATIGLTIERMVIVVQSDPTNSDFTFALLLLVNAVFCLIYAVHGLLREREYELYVLVAAIAVVLTFCVLGYSINPNKRTQVKLIRLILASLLAPVNIVLAVIVARKFGWLEFRIVGASESFQNMYREVARFMDLLKFDFQVAVSFVILALRDGTSLSNPEIITVVLGLAVSLALMLLGWFSVRLEFIWCVVVVALLGIIEPVYVVYKMVNLFGSLPFKKDTMTITYSTMAAGFLALLVRSLLMLEMCIVCKNFGKGLKERVFSEEATERTSLLTAPHRRHR
ncbi:hypothetical protein LSAT2_005315 [Lamellibrachia satsuma]|nr:hypothetical protein LSAT2_005315 [Lamellibrachia satsuma]